MRCRWSVAWLSSACPLVPAYRLQDLPVRWLWSSGGVFRCFLSALLLCSWRIACKYGSISRFNGVFSVVWGCCVGLVGLVLCVACVALYACGVRRIRDLLRVCPSFYPICLYLSLYLPIFSALSLLFFACPLVCLSSPALSL